MQKEEDKREKKISSSKGDQQPPQKVWEEDGLNKRPTSRETRNFSARPSRHFECLPSVSITLTTDLCYGSLQRSRPAKTALRSPSAPACGM